MSPTTQDAYRWIDQHDERLTRLEDQSRETSAQLAANTVMTAATATAMEALREEVKDGFAMLATKWDAKLEDLAPRLTKAEDQLQAQAQTKRAWGKWAMGIAAAIVGTVASAWVLIHMGIH